MKFKTLYQGETGVLINRNGEVKPVEGPQRVFLFMKKLEKLVKITANEHQYLVLNHVNGELKHIPGPTSEWLNRFQYRSIEVKDMYPLSHSQVLIVYNRDNQSNNVNRRIVRGPCIFMPKANEWLHKFQWHAQDMQNIGSINPNGAVFEIMTVKPDFFHYHVKEVRTLDDTLITVKLTVIYELIDIDKMLDKTQDPIADIANAICADVVSYVAKLKFSEYIAESSIKLNNLNTYDGTLQRASRNGFKIENVIYNGYISSPELQSIQDSSIQSRTQIRLNAEIEKQNNTLINLKIESEKKRLNLQTDLKKLKSELDEKLLNMQKSFDLETNQLNHEQLMNLKDLEQTYSNEIKQREISLKEEFLENLSSLPNMSLNKYQLEMCKSRNKCEHVYELLN